MRKFKVTITGLPVIEYPDRNYARYMYPSRIVIEDFDLERVVFDETHSWSEPDSGEQAEYTARQWIKKHLGSKPRSFYVEVPDEIPPFGP